jgi:hypothetical protein
MVTTKLFGQAVPVQEHFICRKTHVNVRRLNTSALKVWHLIRSLQPYYPSKLKIIVSSPQHTLHLYHCKKHSAHNSRKRMPEWQEHEWKLKHACKGTVFSYANACDSISNFTWYCAVQVNRTWTHENSTSYLIYMSITFIILLIYLLHCSKCTDSRQEMQQFSFCLCQLVSVTQACFLWKFDGVVWSSHRLLQLPYLLFKLVLLFLSFASCLLGSTSPCI